VVQLVVVQPEPVPLAVAPLVAVLQASVQHAARPALPEEPWMVAAQQVEGQAAAGACGADACGAGACGAGACGDASGGPCAEECDLRHHTMYSS